MSQKTENKIGFKLLQIKTEQFAILESKVSEKYKLKTNCQIGLDEKKRVIVWFFEFQFMSGATPFIILKTSSHFEIMEASWKEALNKKKVHFEKNFLLHLAVISVGAARGVLVAKTENTKFSSYLLPTIDLTKMITEDLVIDL